MEGTEGRHWRAGKFKFVGCGDRWMEERGAARHCDDINWKRADLRSDSKRSFQIRSALRQSASTPENIRSCKIKKVDVKLFGSTYCSQTRVPQRTFRHVSKPRRCVAMFPRKLHHSDDALPSNETYGNIDDSRKPITNQVLGYIPRCLHKSNDPVTNVGVDEHKLLSCPNYRILSSQNSFDASKGKDLEVASGGDLALSRTRKALITQATMDNSVTPEKNFLPTFRKDFLSPLSRSATAIRHRLHNPWDPVNVQSFNFRTAFHIH